VREARPTATRPAEGTAVSMLGLPVSGHGPPRQIAVTRERGSGHGETAAFKRAAPGASLWKPLFGGTRHRETVGDSWCDGLPDGREYHVPEDAVLDE
jgi:hypothetical protein